MFRSARQTASVRLTRWRSRNRAPRPHRRAWRRRSRVGTHDGRASPSGARTAPGQGDQGLGGDRSGRAEVGGQHPTDLGPHAGGGVDALALVVVCRALLGASVDLGVGRVEVNGRALGNDVGSVLLGQQGEDLGDECALARSTWYVPTRRSACPGRSPSWTQECPTQHAAHVLHHPRAGDRDRTGSHRRRASSRPMRPPHTSSRPRRRRLNVDRKRRWPP